jgi:hypothetical protein
MAAVVLSLSSATRADPPVTPEASPPAAPAQPMTLLDRVVVRWQAPETGGSTKPQFIFERELAFEARLESLADPDPDADPASAPYHDRHVRAALDRHIAETLLAALPILPPPDPRKIALRAEEARGILEQRVRGRAGLIAAAAAEGIGSDEIDALLRRQARASLYLDQMIAPMLEPSEIELRDLLHTGTTPFKDQPFDRVAVPLKRWYVGQRLAQAIDAYFQNARARVVLNVSHRPR